MQVFKGGVPCTALKRGVPQARLRLKLNVEWGATPAAVSHSPGEFMWFWRVSCLEAPDLPSCRSAGVCRRADGNHLSCCRFLTFCACGASPAAAFAGSARGTALPWAGWEMSRVITPEAEV